MGKAKGRGAFIGVFSYDAMSDVGEMVHRLPAPSPRLCIHVYHDSSSVARPCRRTVSSVTL